MMHFKVSEKQEQTRPQISRQKEIIRIKEENNKMQTKQQYKESMKQRVGSLKK
jgi:hypothetical protein